MTDFTQAERFLAAKVLIQAFRDLDGRDTSLSKSETAWNAHEAERFLTDPAGEWAESRVLWCDAADVDPDAVAAMARKAVAGDVPPALVRNRQGERKTFNR